MAIIRRRESPVVRDPSSKGTTGRGSDTARAEMLRRAQERPPPDAPVGAPAEPKKPNDPK